MSRCGAPRAIQVLKIALPSRLQPMHTKRNGVPARRHAHQQHNTKYDSEPVLVLSSLCKRQADLMEDIQFFILIWPKILRGSQHRN